MSQIFHSSSNIWSKVSILGAVVFLGSQGQPWAGVRVRSSQSLVIKGRALESALVPAYIRALNREAPIAGRRVSELRLTAKEATPAAPKMSDCDRPSMIAPTAALIDLYPLSWPRLISLTIFA